MNSFVRALLSCLMPLLVAGPLAAQDTLKVLFVGNSHTYYHALPQMVAGLADAGGHALLAEMSAPGGFTLQQH